jgi:Fic family protein
MSKQVSHIWRPIDDLPVDSKALARPETAALVQAWKEHAQSLKQRAAYDRFLVQLRRQWAIETGILERLYSLSEGATKTLIERGFDEALISHGDTDRPPRDVIAMITDQHHAIEGLYQFISGSRPLGTSYVKELHRVLTENQPRYEAFDTLGNRVQRDLPRGEWKKWPNNVEGPEGFHFEFCPPEHVDAEMERLLGMHDAHDKAGIPPDVEAAWLHHRFTLIHPFADGNGRVARCLATLVLLKAEWLPLVVTRSDRTLYIEALRAADKGDVSQLIRLFDDLQGRVLRQTLSLRAEDEIRDEKIQRIIGFVRERLSSEYKPRDEHMPAFKLCDALHDLASQRLAEVATDIDGAIRPLRRPAGSFHALNRASSRTFQEAGEYDSQLLRWRAMLGYEPDTTVYRSWTRVTIQTDITVYFLFSFHGIGRDTGVFACAAIAYVEELRGPNPAQFRDDSPLMASPFSFTFQEDPQSVMNRFRQWLESAIISGLTYWRKQTSA